MSLDTDAELRADFLAEARELVERLGDELVQLEQRPHDSELLNSVFRSFHTVKGGAGFLGFDPMVSLCHVAEDVFNQLRSGGLVLNAALIDAVLQAHEELRNMLDALSCDMPMAEPRETTLAALRAAASGTVEEKPKAKGKKASKAEPAPPPAPPPSQPSAALQAGSDPIGEDEFEALLDQLHGKGAPPSAVVAKSNPDEPAPKAAAPAVVPRAAAKKAADAAPTAAHNEASAETSVRVDTQKLDDVMNLVGELVLARNRLKTLGAQPGNEALRKALSELDTITGGLQSAVMQLRLQPVRKLFSRFPRLVRDVARKLEKQVEVKLKGEETGLDKSLVEALADPLVHMVRNAIDHGIESPAVRTACGKPAMGTLTLEARQTGDHIEISVIDDGAGIDPERLRRKVVEKRLMDASAATALSPDECLQLVFMAGFSTKEEVSDLSGRGVGMDVVRSHIVALNGTVRIDSVVRHGTTILLRVPLTLAILPVLMVNVGARLFALPLQPVKDVFNFEPERVTAVGRSETVLYRNQPLRLVRLTRWTGEAECSERHVVVIESGVEAVGLVVGQVRGREEIVVKPLGAMLRGLAGLSGATVTGDGRVALIIDLPGLLKAHEIFG